MRTTIDLPDDLHRMVATIARDRRVSFNATVADLLRRVVAPTGAARLGVDPRNGLPVVTLGRPVTSEDVRSMDDDG